MATAATLPVSPKASSAHHELPVSLIYKEFYPLEDVLRINRLASEKRSGEKLRPIYFGTIYVRDGRESAVVDIEGHEWSVSVHGKHINRAFSGDRVAVRLLPRGHWRLKMPPALDLNSESAHPDTERVDALNVIATFEGMADDEQTRNDVMRNLTQLLCDDGFGPSQSGWISLNTVYVTVNAGFTSSNDLNQKLLSSKRKVIKPQGVQFVQFVTDKPPDAASGPIATLSTFSFSDDRVASLSPKSPAARSRCPSHHRTGLQFF
jgi:hypothetical protein